MSPHLNRAILLLQQSRPELAERELRQALLNDPNDPLAHAYLAFALVAQKHLLPAIEEANAAIAAGPDVPTGYHALAVALRQRNRLDEARTAILEAIRLDPEDAPPWSELARIEWNRQDWNAVLEAARQGLALDPSDIPCQALLGAALTRLERFDEATTVLQAALEDSPESAAIHEEIGWTLLHAGRIQEAVRHLREALRLNPLSERAAEGFAEAMKGRNIIYRQFLFFQLWLSRHRKRAGLALFVSALVLYLLAQFAPEWATYTYPIFLPIALLLVSWPYVVAIFDITLQFDRLGRHSLTADQRASSWCAAVAMGVMLTCVILGFATWNVLWIAPVIFAYVFGTQAMDIFRSLPGKFRVGRLGLLAVSAASFYGGVYCFAYSPRDVAPFLWGVLLTCCGMIGVFVGTFLGSTADAIASSSRTRGEEKKS